MCIVTMTIEIAIVMVIMEVHNAGDCGYHQVVVMLIMILHGGMA